MKKDLIGGRVMDIPSKYIVKIDNMYLSEFTFLWVYYGQPCDLLFQKPQTVGCSGIRLVVNNENTVKFLERAKEKTGCELFKVD
ncbi:hypothetical protein AALM16_01020 [Bacteroides caccae]